MLNRQSRRLVIGSGKGALLLGNGVDGLMAGSKVALVLSNCFSRFFLVGWIGKRCLSIP